MKSAPPKMMTLGDMIAQGRRFIVSKEQMAEVARALAEGPRLAGEEFERQIKVP